MAAACGLVMCSLAIPASATAIATVQTGIQPLRGNALDTSGRLWVPYGRVVYSGPDRAYAEVDVARQVAGQGRGCVVATWSCSLVDKNANASQVSIAAGPSGDVWLAFYVADKHKHAALKVARYVGTGGIGCTSQRWSCEIVAENDGFFNTESAPSIAVLADGTPVVAFASGTGSTPATSLFIARRTSGTGCADLDWTCSLVDHAQTGYTGFPAIAIRSSGEIDVAYLRATGLVRLANAQPGAPARGGCAAGFLCQTITSFDPSAFFPSVTLTVGPHDRLWLAYPGYDIDTSTSFVGVAFQDASGSDCFASRFTCERVDVWSAAFALNYASIAFDSLDRAFVAYQDLSFQKLRVAERLGGAGSCSAGGSPGWLCSTVDDDPTGYVGYFPAIARTGSTFSITYGATLSSGEAFRIATL